MPATPYSITPFIYATIEAVPHRDGWLVRPPLVLPTVALDYNNDPDTHTNNARLDHVSGEYQGEPRVLFKDTYLNGASGTFDGRSFSAGGAGTGQWKMYRDEHTDTWGIVRPNNDSSAEMTLYADNITAGLEHCLFRVRRWLPVGLTPTAANWYTYLHLNYQMLPDIRIGFVYGKAVSLEVATETEDEFGLVPIWKTKQMLRNVGTAEQYLAQNDAVYRVRMQPDYRRNKLTLEFGDGNYLHWVPTTDLPTTGRLALVQRSGATTFQSFTIRYGPPDVSSENLKIPPDYGIDDAFFVSNALLGDDADVTLSHSVTDNGDGSVKTTVSASAPDAGEGIGSEKPPKISDGTLVIPAVWSDVVPGGSNPTEVRRLPALLKRETQVWDDVRRNAYTYGELICNNELESYAGGYQRRALDLYDSVDNGVSLLKRLTGVCGIGPGLTLSWMGSERMRVPFCDNSVKLRQPLGQDLIADGWEFGSVHRFLLERGNIDWARFGNTFLPPLYVPPGAPVTAPYGPAGEDAPPDSIILGRGSGVQQRYKFLADMMIEDVQQVLIQETSDFLGRPFRTGIDADGQAHIEPWDPGSLPIIAGYSTAPSSSPLNSLLPVTTPILTAHSSFEVTNSTESMRSELTFQGLNAISYKLMTAHVEMPAWVQEALGWRQPWFERNGRWGTQEYLAYLLTVATYRAMLPQQTVVMTATYHPAIHAGMKIAIDDQRKIGALPGIYIILRMDSIVGEADLSGRGTNTVGDAVIVARWEHNL